MKKVILVGLVVASGCVAFGAIGISCDYPGGNVRVVGVDDASGVVKVAPDLRDTSGNWFHFDFIVTGAEGRKLSFLFPEDRFPYLSSLGPAISSDGGRTWRWLNQDGRRHEPANRFDYAFGTDETKVRFAVSIPYSQKDWDAFMKAYLDNPDVKFETLCKSQSGRYETEMVRVPCRGKARYLVVLTARHHACETTGNPPMEGAFAELMSGSAEGRWLRDNADCIFVPFMDKDGVEAGDQGKDRRPWDHNRDYLKGRYTSVRAIKDLIVRDSVGKRIVFLDLHSPFVRSFKACPEQDQVFSFGIDDAEQNARWNDFRRNWIELQKNGALKYTGAYDIQAGTGHAAVTEKAAREGLVGSRYWVGMLANCSFATCVEFGYSLCGGVNSFVGMRELGANMMKAVVRTVACEKGEPKLFETIMTRGSCRQFDAAKPVSDADIEKILKCAMCAPTAMDRRPWEFVVVRDKAKLDALGRKLPNSRVGNGAQAAIVVCGTLDNGLPDRGKEYWIHDCSAASMNILLAAHGLGLGAVWTAAYPSDSRVAAVREIVGVPEGYMPLNVIPIGYPREPVKPKDKWNPAKVHHDQW